MSHHDRIKALAASEHLAGVPEHHRDGVALEIVNRAGYGADGVPAKPIIDVLRELREVESWWWSTPPSSARSPDRGNMTTAAVAAAAAKPPAPLTAAQKAACDEITANPWRTKNLTEQILLDRFDPSRAARLRVEAGPL